MSKADLIYTVESLIAITKAELSDLEAALRVFVRLDEQEAIHLERDRILKRMMNTPPKPFKAISKTVK